MQSQLCDDIVRKNLAESWNPQPDCEEADVRGCDESEGRSSRSLHHAHAPLDGRLKYSFLWGNSRRSTLEQIVLRCVMGPRISVSTVVRPHEDPRKVRESVLALFPDWNPDSVPAEQRFPSTREAVKLSGAVGSLDVVLMTVREQRVLDTALDAMAMGLADDYTTFSLSRQSALVGKISFVLDGDLFGGTMQVVVEGRDLGMWLEQQTWHSGRDTVPRSAGDEFAMSQEGTPREWFDGGGRRTMGGN